MTKNPKSEGDYTVTNVPWSWDVELTVGVIEDIKSKADFDLDIITNDPEKLGMALLTNPRKLVEIAYVICEEQIKFRQIDAADFGRLFNRAAIDGFGNALIEAIVDFYPRSSAGRAIREALPGMLQKMDDKIYTDTKKRLSDQLLKSAMNSPASSV